jgi:phosphoglycolate phosphatase
MIRACIFDLDGTVLYTLESIALAGNRMLEALGYEGRPLDEYRYYCGDGSDNLVIRCLKKAGGLTPENLEAGKILNRKFLAEKPSFHVRPYEGMEASLKELKKRGYLLAIVSNKPDDAAQLAVKEAYGDLFDHVQGQGKGIPIKPDPAGALAAAASLSAKPYECLYFGDTWTDMQTGKNAGMHTIGVLWGYRDEEELLKNGADRVIKEPSDILTLAELSDEDGR